MELNEFFCKICDCVNEMNSCFGLQLLIGASSGLYTTIYYLYRYCTADDSSFGMLHELHEKVHYFLRLISRTGRLCVPIILGHMMVRDVSALKCITFFFVFN